MLDTLKTQRRATPPYHLERHGQANPAAAATHLCEVLNATATHSSGTHLRLKYILLDQDV